MDFQTFFGKVGGNFSEVMSRLMKEERIVKYLQKFKDSTEMQDLKNSLEAEDYETAFRNSHFLKGMCANLGLSKLQSSCSELCETLRPGKKPEVDITGMLEQIDRDYAEFNSALEELLK